MTTEPTGERFILEAMGGQLIEAEHVVRYALAAQVAAGRRVLDAGCGVGWGTGVLFDAGASQAIGVDLDAEAVADSQARVPGARFVRGDLSRLPFDNHRFDLVVCFEAIEHVGPQEEVLDELTRVLVPGGVLMVSSPNPRVYPPGNPFHVRELTPEDLSDAVSCRFREVALWHQHTQIASALVRANDGSAGSRRDASVQFVSPLVAGGDPYSLVMASDDPLPALPPMIGCAPSDQLLHLEAAAQSVVDQRARMAEDQVRVVAEREMILAERSQLLLTVSEQQHAIESLRSARDHVAVLLLESEQELGRALAARGPAPTRPDTL